MIAINCVCHKNTELKKKKKKSHLNYELSFFLNSTLFINKLIKPVSELKTKVYAFMHTKLSNFQSIFFVCLDIWYVQSYKILLLISLIYFLLLCFLRLVCVQR